MIVYLSEHWPNKFHNEGEQQTPRTRPEESQVGVSCIQPLLDVWFQEDHLISPNFGYPIYRMWGLAAQTPRTLPSLMLYHPVIKHISHMQEGHLHRKGSRNKHFQCLKDPSFHQPSERGLPILVFKMRKLVLRKVTGAISQTSEQLWHICFPLIETHISLPSSAASPLAWLRGCKTNLS